MPHGNVAAYIVRTAATALSNANARPTARKRLATPRVARPCQLRTAQPIPTTTSTSRVGKSTPSAPPRNIGYVLLAKNELAASSTTWADSYPALNAPPPPAQLRTVGR